MASITAAGPDTPISIKVTIAGINKRIKVNFRDLTPALLPNKLRQELSIPSDLTVNFDRYSDSAASYIRLDPSNNSYKSLVRAAKSKGKLRLRADIVPTPPVNLLELSALANALPTVPTLKPQASTSQTTLTEGVFRYPHSAGVSLSSQTPLQTLALSSASASSNSVASNSTARCTLPQSQRGNIDRTSFYKEMADLCKTLESQVSLMTTKPAAPASWSVFCNACDKPMEDEHYHCDICDEGDYDLCAACKNAGIHCRSGSHWLIKRTIQNGQVVSSSTETIKSKTRSFPDIPGAFTVEEKKPGKVEVHIEESTRTCNSCIVALPERKFITCLDCDDFDLCIDCHELNEHGHHPAHTFEPASLESSIGTAAKNLCKPGRNVRHSALCDGCDRAIYGVRYKCLNCPDWDYCSDCHDSVKFIHPLHRFVPIYEPIAESRAVTVRHSGIYCDGHLCKTKKEYISGVRYKCAICHDTDFCASCEASPGNRHNRTHPLIMFKTPVQNVSISTINETGTNVNTLGDRRSQAPVPVQHAPSPVQTILDLKPAEVVPAPAANVTRKCCRAYALPPMPVPVPARQILTDDVKQNRKPRIEIKDLLADPIEEKIKVEDALAPVAAGAPQVDVCTVPGSMLSAHFVQDTVIDGSTLNMNQQFVQSWILKNPGPYTWPAGCSVRYVGGDNMLDVDNSKPFPISDLGRAMEGDTTIAPLAPKECVKLSVRMRAPNRAGTAISYWRLRAPDGHPFGHRLWCHIEMAPPMAPLTVPTVEPSQMIGRVSLSEHQINLLSERPELKADLAPLLAQAQAARYAKQTANRAAFEAAHYARTELPRAGSVSELSASGISSPVSPVAAAKPQHASVADVVDESEGSQMIFPTLEKESPVASVHEAEIRARNDIVVEPSVTASPTVTDPALELFEDAESVDFVDSSDEEEFLTDEEYDILDASDEEGL